MDAEVAEVEVNQEELHMEEADEPHAELDPIQIQHQRREELEYMIKTVQMFEFGSLQEAMSRVGKVWTTTMCVDRTKQRRCWKRVCELPAGDCKSAREEPRDDLFAVMSGLEAKKALFAFAAGMCERRQVKQMFTRRKWVELPDECEGTRKGRNIEEMAVRHEESRVGMGRGLCAKIQRRTGSQDAGQHPRSSSIPKRK